MNIIIIGNGFDLAHGLKTSYRDFINFIQDENHNDRKKYDCFFEWVDKNSKINFDPEWIRICSNKLLGKIIQLNKDNWCDIEALYYEELLKADSPKILNEEFHSIKYVFEDYIHTHASKSNKIKGLETIFSSLGQSHVINFNYTKTYEHYEEYFKKVHNIHGQVKDETNPIIFGYAATEEKTFELLNRNDDGFIKNIKQYEYLNTDSYQSILKMLESSTKINVLLFGHSCGASDSLILKSILSHSNVRRIFNFYYQDMHNHKKTLININRTTSQKTGFSKFMSYPDSIRIPQFDNDLRGPEIAQFLELKKRFQL